MMICNGVRTQITHFKFLPISPLIFATVQKFALDYFRDQQILTPPCEWGWVLVVPLLGKTFEVEDSPGMVWSNIRFCVAEWCLWPNPNFQHCKPINWGVWPTWATQSGLCQDAISHWCQCLLRIRDCLQSLSPYKYVVSAFTSLFPDEHWSCCHSFPRFHRWQLDNGWSRRWNIIIH